MKLVFILSIASITIQDAVAPGYFGHCFKPPEDANGWRHDVPPTPLSLSLTAGEDSDPAVLRVDPGLREKQEDIAKEIPWLGSAGKWDSGRLTKLCDVSLLDLVNGERTSNIAITSHGCAELIGDQGVIRFPGDAPYFVDTIEYINDETGRFPNRKKVPLFALLRMDRARGLDEESKRLRLSNQHDTKSGVSWLNRNSKGVAGRVPFPGANDSPMPAMKAYCDDRAIPKHSEAPSGTWTGLLFDNNDNNNEMEGSPFYWYPYKNQGPALKAIGSLTGTTKGYFVDITDYTEQITDAIKRLENPRHC